MLKWPNAHGDDDITAAPTMTRQIGGITSKAPRPARQDEFYYSRNYYSNPALSLTLKRELKKREDSQEDAGGSTDAVHLLPYFNGAKTYMIKKNPMQKEYLDAVKTQFFSLGMSSGASLHHEYFPVFRGIFLISLFFSLYGGDVFIWRRSKVDYTRVLGVSYAHTYQYVLRGSTTMAYIIFTMFMLYFMTITGEIERQTPLGASLKHIWPALSFIIPFLLFICPWDDLTKIFFGVGRNGFKQRWGLILETGAVLISPFSKVTFLRSFIADIFCSMPRIFTDLQYTVCIYATGAFADSANEAEEWAQNRQHSYNLCGSGYPPYYTLQVALAFLPYYLRLCQSIRAFIDTGELKHVGNAVKYSMSLAVTGLATLLSSMEASNPLRVNIEIAWVAVGVTTTLYAFYWDVVMDWGLGNLNCSYVFLRDELYFQPGRYYGAIALDFVMRLGWAFVISPDQPYLQQSVMLLLGAVELIRRCLWSIFRVEWEHIQLNMKSQLLRAESQMKRMGASARSHHSSTHSGDYDSDRVLDDGGDGDNDSADDDDGTNGDAGLSSRHYQYGAVEGEIPEDDENNTPRAAPPTAAATAEAVAAINRMEDGFTFQVSAVDDIFSLSDQHKDRVSKG